jgi:hypothetical protein
MVANAELIDGLNRALSLELAGVIQYLQQSFLVTGLEREVYRSFFRELSSEARDLRRGLEGMHGCRAWHALPSRRADRV